MNKNKNFFIGLIPAKKNSSELKNKNFLKLNNIPLYQIALFSSLKSKYILDTYISSDSKEVLIKSKKIGAKILSRPKKLSIKSALADDVVKHFVNYLKIKKIFNREINIIYLQPTSPFRNHHHVNKAIFVYIKNKYKPLLSICFSKKPIEKSLVIKKNKISNFFKKKSSVLHTENRQNLKKTFYANGAIYIFKIKDFLKKNKIPIFDSTPFKMNDVSSIDIDSKFDYEIAKLLSKKHVIYKR